MDVNHFYLFKKQFIANIVVLACVNLAGWLLRQSIIQDRAEIRSYEGNSRFHGKHKYLQLALRRQADKLVSTCQL